MTTAPPSAETAASSRFLSLGLRLPGHERADSPAWCPRCGERLESRDQQQLCGGCLAAPQEASASRLGPDDSVLIGLLRGATGSGVCSHCLLTCHRQSACFACNELVCNDCLPQHAGRCRQPLSLSSLSLGSSLTSSPESPSNGDARQCHPGHACCHLSEDCSLTVCQLCAVGQHSGHSIVYKGNARPLLPLATAPGAGGGWPQRIGHLAAAAAAERLEQKEAGVAAQYEEAARRVRAHFKQLRELVGEREAQLLGSLLQVKAQKLKTLGEQRLTLQELAACSVDIGHLLQPWEDERIFCVQPPLDVARLIRTSCAVYSSACASLCRLAIGAGAVAFVGKQFTFRLLAFDHLRQPCALAASDVDLQLRLDARDSGQASAPYGQVQPSGLPGQYQVSTVPECAGRLTVAIRLRGRHVPGSPFSVSVLESRDYSQLGAGARVIGCQGDGDLEFNRPWGICADEQDNLVVADRSNNQIKVLHSSGRFVRKFGQRGQAPGQFNRPAGVCLGAERRIFVADKDNHRVQVFTWTGQFVRAFGKQGKGPAEFNYPWDLAVSREGRLAVADSRNHRVQLFSEEGDYLTEFSISRSPSFAGVKSFDCPRGVAFTATGQLLCTDFNLHRFLVIEPDFSHVRFVGTEGQGPGQFCRPQGIAVDSEGNIVICEARNHRLQILNSRGIFVQAFGAGGSPIGQLNRPACVCVLSGGQLAVVDSENHRLLLL